VTFFYDPANRLTSVEEPTGRPRRYTYNGRDLIVRDTQIGGERQQDYTYDASGRLTSVKFTNLRNTSDFRTTSFLYDSNGNRTDVRRATGNQSPVPRLSRSFDPLNRITRYTDGLGNSLFYSYDSAGNLKELTYPDGKKVLYAYDAAGRLVSVTDWAQRVTRYTYDQNGRMTQASLPNGTLRLMAYDAAGRIVRRRDLAGNGAVIVEYQYSYDAAGQLISENGTHATAPNFTPSTVMAYDNANKLTSVDAQAVVNDEDGNVTSFKGKQYQYDVQGNMTLANGVTYLYDEEDRLIRFVSAAGPTTFVVNPAATLSQVLTRTSPNGAITRYVYGAGLLYEEMSNGQIRTYHFDARGSTAAFADGAGGIAARVGYGPYGELLNSTQSLDSPFLHNGLFGVITDPNGLNYMRFRWYSPELKRFMNRDAHFGDITNVDSLNRFSFVGGSPMMRVDPEGQFWWVAAGALVGAVAAVAVKAASDMITGKFSGWEAYAGAAVGGAVTGALLAACPACGVLGSAAIGAAGGAAAYLTEKGLRGQAVSADELALEALGGAAAGGIGGGAGKLSAKLGGKAASGFAGKLGGKIANRLGKAAARQGIYGRGALIKGALARETPVAFVKGLVGAAVSEGLSRTGAGGVMDRFLLNVGTTLSSLVSQTSGGNPETSHEAIHAEARLNLNRNRKSAFGEFIHWQFWLDSLQAASRPIPNNPNNLLTSF
jgi:RHS repeat-associated protein